MTELSMIPRRALFGDPDRYTVRLSPDGRWLAWFAPHEGARNVWVGPAEDPDAARPLTRHTGRGASGWYLQWAGNSRTVLYPMDRDGDENWIVMAVDVETGAQRELSPPGASAWVDPPSSRLPDEVIVFHNARDPRWHDAHRVDVRTGASRMAVRNDADLSLIVFDLDLQPRLATRIAGNSATDLLRPSAEGWTTIRSDGPEDALCSIILTVTDDGRGGHIAHVLNAFGRDRMALHAMDCRTGAQGLLHAHDGADVTDVWPDPATGIPLAAIADPGRRDWTFFDPALEADHAWLAARIDGEPWITGHSTDLSRWVVFADSDDGRGHYWLFDRPSRGLRRLFPQRAALRDHRLSPMRVERMETRDGLTLVNYLTLPADTAERAAGRPAEPLPMVLHVHGGPWDRQSWHFHAETQWLANRGYAVLSVNFRGSTGFGKAFVNAGNGEWAGAMHADLIDAVDWAVAEGIADPARVAIMGASYGGYAALVGLTFTPDVFACAIDLVGPANLSSLLEHTPPYWISFRPWLLRATGGDPATEEGRAALWARSPLSRVDAIRRPLLIGQGANDVRVQRGESDQIFEAMRARGLPVTYALFPDEGHVLTRPENRLAFHALAELFLARHLGGRAEPIGDAFAGSSIELQPGSEPI